VTSSPPRGTEGACVFCDALAAPDTEESLVVRREPLAFLLLNRYPYNSGHCMVLPNRHVTELSDLTPEESAAVFGLLARTVDLLRSSMKAEAVNVGGNLGRHAGGSIDHLHLHCVPRWAGDTNFMPVVAETKVLVEMLGDTRRRLARSARAWDEPPA